MKKLLLLLMLIPFVLNAQVKSRTALYSELRNAIDSLKTYDLPDSVQAGLEQITKNLIPQLEGLYVGNETHHFYRGYFDSLLNVARVTMNGTITPVTGTPSITIAPTGVTISGVGGSISVTDTARVNGKNVDSTFNTKLAVTRFQADSSNKSDSLASAFSSLDTKLPITRFTTDSTNKADSLLDLFTRFSADSSNKTDSLALLQTAVDAKASTSRINGIADDSLVYDATAIDDHTLGFRSKNAATLITLTFNEEQFRLENSGGGVTINAIDSVAGNTDWNGYGMILTGQTYNGSVSAGELCYFTGTEWDETDASAVETSSGMLGMALGSNQILTLGIWTTTGLTAGATYYISETQALITSTAPTAGGSTDRVVGYALSTTQLYFNPSAEYTTN